MVPSDRTRGSGHKSKHKEFHLNRRICFTEVVVEHRLPRKFVEHPWRYSNLNWAQSVCLTLDASALMRVAGIGELQRCLPTSVILQFFHKHHGIIGDAVWPGV